MRKVSMDLYVHCGTNCNHMVGAAGFEPATTWSQTRRATGLRYTPFSNCECKGTIIF